MARIFTCTLYVICTVILICIPIISIAHTTFVAFLSHFSCTWIKCTDMQNSILLSIIVLSLLKLYKSNKSLIFHSWSQLCCYLQLAGSVILIHRVFRVHCVHKLLCRETWNWARDEICTTLHIASLLSWNISFYTCWKDSRSCKIVCTVCTIVLTYGIYHTAWFIGINMVSTACTTAVSRSHFKNTMVTLTVLVTTIDAQWEGMGDVGSARYELALLPPCPTIRVLSYSN